MDVNAGRSCRSSSFTDDNALSRVRRVVSNGKPTIAKASTFWKLFAPNSISINEERSSKHKTTTPTSNEELPASIERAGKENEIRHRREVCK